MRLGEELYRIRVEKEQKREKATELSREKAIQSSKDLAEKYFNKAAIQLLYKAKEGFPVKDWKYQIETNERFDGNAHAYLASLCEEQGIYYHCSDPLPPGGRFISRDGKMKIILTFSATEIQEELKEEKEEKPTEPKCCQLCKKIRKFIHP
ncbi:MAG: hypothetical protein ACOXZS_04205 [Bacilli bacterium]